jgi:putative redox protein
MIEQIDLAYTGNLRCSATLAASGQTLLADVPKEYGGPGEAFSASDLVAAALGACVMGTLAFVAQRNHLDLAGMTAKVEKEMTVVPVRRIGSMKLVVSMPKGLRLSEDDRNKLETAAGRCPVKQSLHPDIHVEVEFVYP